MFKLPPLNALRAFEVAARHKSIKHAAAELNVTAGAVSRHVQSLEKHLGIQLFKRHNRELSLTENGRQYMAALSDAFGRIDAATTRMTDRRDRPHIRICSPITFTMRWLVPRLPSFSRQHPGLDVNFTTTLTPPDSFPDKFDIAIRAMPLRGEKLRSHLLFETDLLPVCSPKLLAAGERIRAISDLRRHTLIHSSGRPGDWAGWLRAMNDHTVDATRGIIFETSSLAYQAALQGLGIVLGQRAFVCDEIASGRLVVPLDMPLRGHSRYFVTYRDDAAAPGHLKTFCTWLLDRAKEAEAPTPPYAVH